jgi:hypothetical protein
MTSTGQTTPSGGETPAVDRHNRATKPRGPSVRMLRLAADQPDNPNPPTTSTRQGSGGGQSDEGNRRITSPPPKPPPTDRPEGNVRETEPATPTPPPLEASVSVSPEQVKRGERITADVTCPEGTGSLSLDWPDVRMQGVAIQGANLGKVKSTASLGDHTVTLVCNVGDPDGSLPITATGKFRVVPTPPPVTASVSVSPEQVKRGERITAEVTCSPGAVPLSLDWPDVMHGAATQGANLGTVKSTASLGDHTVTLVCGDSSGKATATDKFQVVGDGPDRPGGPGGGGPGNGNAEPPAGGQYVPVYPKGGVATGGGPVAGSPVGGPLDGPILSSPVVRGEAVPAVAPLAPSDPTEIRIDRLIKAARDYVDNVIAYGTLTSVV